MRAPRHWLRTPIPRTLALTVYGDLQVSEIAKPPADRKPIVTAWVTAERSSEAYMRLRRHLDDVMPGARMRHRLGFRHTIAWTKPG